MSQLTEYLKLIPKGLKNLDKVVEGISNQVKLEYDMLSQEEKEIIIGRRAICHVRPFNSKNATLVGIYKTDRTDDHCIHCGCPITTRTASLESACGIKDYNEKNPDNTLNLKWDKVK